MKPYRMIRRGKSMTSLDIVLHQGGAREEETTTLTSTSSHSTLMTFSKTLALLVNINNNNTTNTTFTPTLIPTTRDTLTATSRLIERPWMGTGGSFSRAALAEDYLMICLRTWRRCFLFTRTAPGLRTGFRAQGSNTAGQWRSVGGTWWPPSLTAPKTGWIVGGFLCGFWNWKLIYHLVKQSGFVWLFVIVCNFLYEQISKLAWKMAASKQ